MKTLVDIPFQQADGQETKLAEYGGKVLLLVNTASRCGFTKQYEGLQTLQERYAERGFSVLAFPANDFLNQEPGSNEEIQNFCSVNFGIQFPVFGKISVKGKNQHPLYAWLTSEETNPGFAGAISWNFNKFLIGRDGRVLARFGSRDAPLDDKVVAAIEAALDSGE